LESVSPIPAPSFRVVKKGKKALLSISFSIPYPLSVISMMMRFSVQGSVRCLRHRVGADRYSASIIFVEIGFIPIR